MPRSAAKSAAGQTSMPLPVRKPLSEITEVPDDIISVYVVESHIWADRGSAEARRQRRPELRTVREFLISPVRSFLVDIFRQMAAPWERNRKDSPVGQGYWIQAEFGSGKSHVLSFLGALALGDKEAWEIVRDKEQDAGLGRRESLYTFYENGLAKKSEEGRGILVAVKTLVGQGGGAVGIGQTGRSLTEYVLNAVAEAFHAETGKTLPLYPTERLAERFLNTADFDRFRGDLAKYLKDPNYFDVEQREDINDFLRDLRHGDPSRKRDCGQRLWDFYTQYLNITPNIEIETEPVLKRMVERLLEEGYSGLLLILDEVSLFMKNRVDAQRVEDEKALVVLSNRLAKVENLPIWTVCAAQQAIETTMPGVKNIIARERLDLIPLLSDPNSYYDIALSRVRRVTDPTAIDPYYEDYKKGFSWPQSRGKDEFARFFPFYPPSIDVVRNISLSLTTIRSALYFMLQTLKTQRKAGSRELISLWSLFDDVVNYEEDPSGTTRSIAAVKTRWPSQWKAYETAIRQLDTATGGHMKVHRSRCERIIKTLFLYHIANMAQNGLSSEDLMNAVMEWKDHQRDQSATLQDNQDHYEILADAVASELAQVKKVGANYAFFPTGGGPDPRDHFQRERARIVGNEVSRREAWRALLALNDWAVRTRLMTLDLSQGVRSIFRDIAPESHQDLSIVWHGRRITGRVYMRDLIDVSRNGRPLPRINSADTGLDFAVFVSSTPAGDELSHLVESRRDGRELFWAPGALTAEEQDLLVDFATYRALVSEFSGRETQEAKEVLEWLQERLRDQMGRIYRIVPDSYGRGRISALDHAEMPFTLQGELSAMLTPLVGQALDSVYESRDLVFDAPAPFDDTNALNVINGIVKQGEIPRGARPTKEVSAARNYALALGIVRRGDGEKLDISGCRYANDMLEWLEDKLPEGGWLSVSAVHKNFMGVDGPGGHNYGLSERLVQLYLLCLVRLGKIRLSFSGSAAPAPIVDYNNIADVDFRVPALKAMDQVQRLKPPEGWEALAPFAAILLGDDSVRGVQKDSDIQAALSRLLKLKTASLREAQALQEGLELLFQDLGQSNPLADRVSAWVGFLSAHVDEADPLPYLLNALDQHFGYSTYDDGQADQSEVEDFANRKDEIRRLEAFYGHRDALRAAARYVHELAEQSADGTGSALPTFSAVEAAFERLGELIASESRLVSELVGPAAEAIETYRVRYLQLLDEVAGSAEEARQALGPLPDSPAWTALERLARLPQLGGDPLPALQRRVEDAKAELFPALTRAEVERELRLGPFPRNCPLTFANAGEWLDRADAAVSTCEAAISAALDEKAALLLSPALRQRLEQGRDQEYVESLLSLEDLPSVRAFLLDTLGGPTTQQPDPIEVLARYLREVRVRKLRLADFTPSKRTLEAADVATVVGEFRRFLEQNLTTDGDELAVLELE